MNQIIILKSLQHILPMLSKSIFKHFVQPKSGYLFLFSGRKNRNSILCCHLKIINAMVNMNILVHLKLKQLVRYVVNI